MRAPHLVKATAVTGGGGVGPLGSYGKRKTIPQTRSQSLQEPIFCLSVQGCHRSGAGHKNWALVIVGMMSLCWELKANPGVCPRPSTAPSLSSHEPPFCPLKVGGSHSSQPQSTLRVAWEF